MHQMAQQGATTQQLVELIRQERVGGGIGKPWHHHDRFRSLKPFGGKAEDYEEWITKLRSAVSAADFKVHKLMMTVEADCTEEELVKGKYNELVPEFGEEDEEFILQTSAQIHDVLLHHTTGEANATVRRSDGAGWLAWKRLTSALNPRTMTSGVLAVDAVLRPPKIATINKADVMIEQWEHRVGKLNAEYSQTFPSKILLGILFGMVPKEMQEKLTDLCGVSWDGTSEAEAARLFERIKCQLKNTARARREAQAPRAMEVDRISNWAGGWQEDWGDGWDWSWGYMPQEQKEETTAEEEATNHHDNHDYPEDGQINYVGKGGGKSKGRGFQGHCYVCGEFGHSQWDCQKGGGKGKGKDGSKGFGKSGWDGGYKGYKGYGKNGWDGNKGYKGYGKNSWDGGYKGFKGYGKDGWAGKNGWGGGKGQENPKGTQRACFTCGATDHLMKDCPEKVQQVQKVEEPEVLFIGKVGSVEEEWKRMPMKIKVPKMPRWQKQKTQKDRKKHEESNRFKVLEVDELDDSEDEVLQVAEIRAETDSDVEEHNTFKVLDVDAVDHEFGEPARIVGHNPRGPWRNRGMQGRRRGGEETEIRAVQGHCSEVHFGRGDIIVDSAADESCWPVGQGDAFPTVASKRELKLRTANGGEMRHYGEKQVTFRYSGGEGRDPVGLRFQVTDVRRPLLAVRRLVERGNTVVMSDKVGGSYIENKATKVRIPIIKKAGSFVIEAQFVKGFTGQA